MSHRGDYTVFKRWYHAGGWLRVCMIAACTVVSFNGSRGQTSPHGTMLLQCEDCHSATSWKEMASPMRFNHAKTSFPLNAQHAVVKCKQCHTSLKFSEAKTGCADCHADVHRGELGAMCDRCHSPQSWLVPDMLQRHARTRFALIGVHQTVPCQACHVNQVKHEYVNTPTDCFGCHRTQYDATLAPAHRTAGIGTDCAGCHAVTAMRWGGGFDHSKTAFALTGAHLATACSQCHVGNRYQGIASQCVSCHQQQYNATTNPKHAPPAFSTDCQTCHSTSAWQPSAFDHNKTNFKLNGAHAAVPCSQCHVNNRYQGTATQCANCHQQQYTVTTNPKHSLPAFPTDCQTCHSTTAWRPGTLDHSKTAFPLTGAHVAVPCTQCHVNNQYQGTATQCGNCHQLQYNTAANPKHSAPAFPTDCQTCHSTTAWRPGSLDHKKTNFPLTGAHVPAPCVSCHINGIFTGTSNQCGVCHLQKYNATTNPKHLAAGFPTDCQPCHTTTAWQPARFAHDTFFPISAGSRHSPGRWSTCADCHTASTNFKVFSCIDCHEHAQSNVSQRHNGVRNYTYTSTACYTCHPRGNAG